jgi:hypothetical protein
VLARKVAFSIATDFLPPNEMENVSALNHVKIAGRDGVAASRRFAHLGVFAVEMVLQSTV